MRSVETFDADHPAAAAGTGQRFSRSDDAIVVCRDHLGFAIGCGRVEQFSTQRQLVGAVPVREQTIMANAMEADRAARGARNGA